LVRKRSLRATVRICAMVSRAEEKDITPTQANTLATVAGRVARCQIV
jgi:hypothetical protein